MLPVLWTAFEIFGNTYVWRHFIFWHIFVISTVSSLKKYGSCDSELQKQVRINKRRYMTTTWYIICMLQKSLKIMHLEIVRTFMITLLSDYRYCSLSAKLKHCLFLLLSNIDLNHIFIRVLQTKPEPSLVSFVSKNTKEWTNQHQEAANFLRYHW